MRKHILRVREVLSKISFKILGIDFTINANIDKLNPKNGRIYLQISYMAPCTKTGEIQEWFGRKWYLSEYMTDDEIIKTGFAACKAAVGHEILEGYKVNGIILFNPHVNYEALLSISHHEITREKH